MNIKILLIFLMIGNYGCHGQKNTNMDAKNNPLLCDPETGICELPAGQSMIHNHATISSKEKPVKIVYFTDPICSSCWGIEPQLRRLKLEYGNDVEIEYHMGGLLPDWSYNSGGISKPSDVAHHWDEVSQHYKMPIDGDVWLEDPLHSSYPPSIAFKAAQIQDEYKAIAFLRHLREMVFLQKKNITKWEHIASAASKAGLDTGRLKQDYEGKAKEMFEDDLTLARKIGVRGFPTIFITGANNVSEMVYGTKPYSAYEAGIIKVYSQAAKKTYAKDWKSLFEKYPTLTTREFAELGELSFEDAEATLKSLTEKGDLTIMNTKNGALWIKKT